jgi:hypothetical protein
VKLIDAVAHAAPGDRIELAGGMYHLDKPLTLDGKGRGDGPIQLRSAGPDRAILDFAGEPEDKKTNGINLAGDYWEIDSIEVTHAGHFGVRVSGNHNVIRHCAIHENRNTGLQIEGGGGDNLIENCDSFRNYDPKTLGEDADGFTAKHRIGPGNVFRGCRSYQNADDGWDLWMATSPVLIEDCISFRNGYNIFKCPDFQGDGNGFKFGGNYVDVAHTARRCVSIENPFEAFDQNHNLGSVILEDCVAIRCGKGFCFPEQPRDGRAIVLRRCTSFACDNVLTPTTIQENCRWYSDIPTGTLGPPPRPGHRPTTGAGEVPTTQPAPLHVPEGAPDWGRPWDTPATQPYPEPS